LTQDFQNSLEFLRLEFDAFLSSHMNFIPLDQTESPESETTSTFIETKGGYNFITTLRDNPGFTYEKRMMAHTQSESFLLGLSQQKQSKFMKEFKEIRTQALEAFVNSISSIN
jgi:hypothetical protein